MIATPVQRVIRVSTLWVVIFCAVPLAKAAIVFRDIEDVPLFLGSPYRFYHLDFNGDAVEDALFRSSIADFQVLSTATSRIAGLLEPPPDIGSFAGAFHSDELIGLGLNTPWTWNSGLSGLIACTTIGCLGYWGDNIDYVGVQFAIGGETHYGWVEVQVPFIGVNGGWVRSYAYETEPGVAITAGAVPEPATALLLCVGFAASATRRSCRCTLPLG